MTKDRLWLGKYGEDQASDFLAARGYKILQRNARNSDGEIDIVAMDGSTLVFIEVKTRTSTFSGHPFTAVTPAKMARIRRVAAAWCSMQKVASSQVRFDAIAVLVHGGRVGIEHLKQVV